MLPFGYNNNFFCQFNVQSRTIKISKLFCSTSFNSLYAFILTSFPIANNVKWIQTSLVYFRVDDEDKHSKYVT